MGYVLRCASLSARPPAVHSRHRFSSVVDRTRPLGYRLVFHSGNFDAAIFRCPACHISVRNPGLRAGTFPTGISCSRHQDQWHDLACASRRPGSRGRDAARVWRHGRHVGTGCSSAGQESHRRRSRSARHGPVGASRHGLHEKRPGRGYCGRHGCLEHPEGRSGHARYRQHGRVCPGGAIPGPHHQVGCDRCTAARNRQLGRDQAKPAALALQLPRTGHGAVGGGPRAHLPRPFLQRAVRRSEKDR